MLSRLVPCALGAVGALAVACSSSSSSADAAGASAAQGDAGTSTPGASTGGATDGDAGAGCTTRQLVFSADALPAVPDPGAGWVWGGHSTDGEPLLDPPYSDEFRAHAVDAHARGALVFAYLEGPCGNTGGVDDGEQARCKSTYQAFNARFAPGTPDTTAARWKPYTFEQLKLSGSLGVDYCEIDNLSNAVEIPLNPLLAEIKAAHDAGTIHCRIVLKNVDVAALDAIRADVAKTPADADFLAPFAIFEADDTRGKADLDAAMQRLKGPGAVTIVSTDTFHYGAAFTKDTFTACP